MHCVLIQHQFLRQLEAVIIAGTVYINDHGSSPPLRGVLAGHIAAGRVRYTWWDPGNFTSRVTR